MRSACVGTRKRWFLMEMWSKRQLRPKKTAREMCQGRMGTGLLGPSILLLRLEQPPGEQHVSSAGARQFRGPRVPCHRCVILLSENTICVPSFSFFFPAFFIIQQNSVRPWSEIFLFTKEISAFGHKPNKIGHWMPLKYLVIAWNSAAGSCSNKRVSLFRGSCSEFPCDEYPDAYGILLGTAVSHPIPWRGGMSKLWLFKLANKVER